MTEEQIKDFDRMVKPLRRGNCPLCGRSCRRKWLSRLPDGRWEIFQPFCARCTDRRGKHGAGWWDLLPPEAVRCEDHDPVLAVSPTTGEVVRRSDATRPLISEAAIRVVEQAFAWAESSRRDEALA